MLAKLKNNATHLFEIIRLGYGPENNKVVEWKIFKNDVFAIKFVVGKLKFNIELSVIPDDFVVAEGFCVLDVLISTDELYVVEFVDVWTFFSFDIILLVVSEVQVIIVFSVDNVFFVVVIEAIIFNCWVDVIATIDVSIFL